MDSLSPSGSILRMAALASGGTSGGTNFSALAFQCASTYWRSRTAVIWRMARGCSDPRVTSVRTTP